MKSYFYDLRYIVDSKEWRARAKRDLVFRLVKKYSGRINNKLRVLDFGCGTGILQEQLEKKFSLDVYGIDASKTAIKYCKKRGLSKVKLSNSSKIPFKSNFFDIVTAIDVVEHVKDDLKALTEIKRVLKRNGISILLVPAHSKLWSARDVNLRHFRRYNIGELEDKCRSAGLTLLTNKNVDFAIYFLFKLLHTFAPKIKGVAQMGMDTAMTNILLNEVMYMYELLENRLQDFTTFPVGLSIGVVVRKVK